MNKQEMLKRCYSAAIIGAVMIFAIMVFRPLFYILCYAIAGLMLFEWHNMTSTSKRHNFIGLAIIPIPIACLMLISYIDYSGWLLITLFVTIWSMDVMALVGGKRFKGPKLAPKISPEKTYSGLIVGTISAVVIVNLLSLLPWYSLPHIGRPGFFLFSLSIAVLALIAQAGDFFESYFKRKFKIKDSGSIIPGHGGVLDRFDSLIFAAPIVFLYFAIIV